MYLRAIASLFRCRRFWVWKAVNFGFVYFSVYSLIISWLGPRWISFLREMGMWACLLMRASRMSSFASVRKKTCECINQSFAFMLAA